MASLPQETPSNVIPVLVAALVCDVAATDPSTGKKNLIGVFDTVWVGQFPTKRPLYLYIKLADADGFYRLRVTYVQLGTGEVLGEATGELRAENRLQSSDFYLNFTVQIPAQDRYDFQVWANDTYIGSAFLDAKKRPDAKSGGKPDADA